MTTSTTTASYDTVLVVAPLTQGMTSLITKEIDDLTANGSRVHVIVTDTDAISAMGPNSLDPRFRQAAAEHGLRQGKAAAISL